MITFDEFFDSALGIVFPDDPAEELAVAYRRYAENALIHLQSYVKCLQDNHVEWWKTSQMSAYGGVSSVTLRDHPMVQSVYAFLPGTSSDRFFFNSRSVQFIQSLSNLPGCDDMAMPYDPYEHSIYEDSSEVCEPCDGGLPVRDIGWESARHYYAIGPSSKLILAPRIPCDYVLAVHWNGIKRTWQDTDLITDDADVIDAVARYIHAEHALRQDRDVQLARELSEGFNMRLGELMRRCRLETEVKPDVGTLAGPDDISGWFDPNALDNPYTGATSACP